MKTAHEALFQIKSSQNFSIISGRSLLLCLKVRSPHPYLRDDDDDPSLATLRLCTHLHI